MTSIETIVSLIYDQWFPKPPTSDTKSTQIQQHWSDLEFYQSKMSDSLGVISKESVELILIQWDHMIKDVYTYDQVACLMLIVPIKSCFHNVQKTDNLDPSMSQFRAVLSTKDPELYLGIPLCTIARRTNNPNFEVTWIPCELTYLRLFGYDYDDLRGVVLFEKKLFFTRPLLSIKIGK